MLFEFSTWGSTNRDLRKYIQYHLIIKVNKYYKELKQHQNEDALAEQVIVCLKCSNNKNIISVI